MNGTSAATRLPRSIRIPVSVAIVLVIAQSIVFAQAARRIPDDIGFSPQLGASIPLDLEFRDHHGRRVRLEQFFRDQPVIVVPVYYRCPMLCGLELNGLVRCLRAMSISPGSEFQIVTVSIDPRETPALAAQKRATYLAEYGREQSLSKNGTRSVPTNNGWHFLTGEQTAIERLCEAIGFRTAYDEQSGQYAHAAGIVVCTPEGKIARYFYGVEFLPRDLRLGLLEASRKEIATFADQVQLYCYMYDPTTGKYGLAILALVRAGGVMTVAVLVTAVVLMLYRERRGQTAAREAAAQNG
jgi:protein SCO1/2